MWRLKPNTAVSQDPNIDKPWTWIWYFSGNAGFSNQMITQRISWVCMKVLKPHPHQEKLSGTVSVKHFVCKIQQSVLPPRQVQNPQKQNPLWKLNVGNYDLEVYIFKLCQCKLNHMEMVERWVFAIRISNECFSWRRSCNRIHSSCVLQFQFVEIICVQLNSSFNTQSCCILSLSIDCVVESGEECNGWSCWHGSELAFERT